MSRGTNIAIWSAAAIAALLVVAVSLLATFDWNRAKPWISKRVSETTGRQFDIHGDLSLTWHAPLGVSGWRAWIPWPRLSAQQITIGNPDRTDWDNSTHMAQVQQVVFAVSPLALLRRKLVIPSLAVEAPQLHLQRLADGRNNWTFDAMRDSDETPWQIDLQRIILNKGSVRLVDAMRNADLRADIDTLGNRDDEYRIGWRIGGSFNGEQVSGNGRAGNVLILRDRNTRYPLDASLRIGKTVIVANGTISSPAHPSEIDFQLKMEGVTMAHLYPLIGVVLPETRPFITEGRLLGKPGENGGEWTYENFSGKVGNSDLSGTLRFRGGSPRGRLEGSVVSGYLDFNDLSPLVGSDSERSRVERGIEVRQPADKILPVESFKKERWTSIDANVEFSGKKIVRREALPVNNLVTHIRLEDGILSLAPLKFGMAGGHLVSTIRLDGNADPVRGEVKISAQHLKLKELFPKLAGSQGTLGEMNGEAVLGGAGNSVAALLASASGQVRAVANEGTMSKLALESMGMNLGSMMVMQLFGDKQVRIHCAAADFELRHGVMHARAFIVDTEEAILNLDGNIDLAKEKISLTLYPESKGLRLISLRSPVFVIGSFKKPKMVVDKGALAMKAGSAIALGVLAPVASALLPLVNVGPGEDSQCGSLLARATAKPSRRSASSGNGPRSVAKNVQASGN